MSEPNTGLRGVFARIPRWAYVLGALLVALIFPQFLNLGMDMVWMRVADRALVYVLLAIGLNLVMGETGLLNLGYVAFFAVGSYTTAILSSPKLGFHVPFLVLVPLSIVVAMLVGLLITTPTLRLRGDYLAIVTLAFGEITRITFNNLEGVTNGPSGLPGIYHPAVGPLSVVTPSGFYYLILAAIAVVIVLLTNLKNSRIGRAWNALREDEIAAHHTGIQPMKLKLLSVVISAGIAGLAGSLFAYYQSFINPSYFVFRESVYVVCMVVLGGMGSIPGAVVGALALSSLPEFVRQAFSNWLPNTFPGIASSPAVASFLSEFDRYRMLLVGIVIVIMVILRPEGLLPDKLWRREVHEEDPREQEKTRQALFDVESGRQDLEA